MRDDFYDLHRPGPNNALVGQMGWDGIKLTGTANGHGRICFGPCFNDRGSASFISRGIVTGSGHEIVTRDNISRMKKSPGKSHTESRASHWLGETSVLVVHPSKWIRPPVRTNLYKQSIHSVLYAQTCAYLGPIPSLAALP